MSDDERRLWESEVLDFLTLRGGVMFDNWSPAAFKELVRLLSHADWELILAANILASPVFAEGIDIARRLVPRELEQRDNRVVRAGRGRLYGRVLPRDTLRMRLRQRDSTLWITEELHRAWQTDHNSALVGFLSHMHRSATEVLVRVPEGLQPHISRSASGIERLLRMEPIRNVVADARWDRANIPAQLWAKSRLYGLWRYALALRRGRRQMDAADLRSALQDGWLRTESEDRLFELYALSRVIALLYGSAVWDKFEVRGLWSGEPLSVMATGGPREVLVAFDQTPTSEGEYAWILARYKGIDGRGRRPDLRVESNTPGKGRRVTLIEVKATNPNSEYGRDSIVKVLGYLKDFRRLWSHEPTVEYPRAVVLYRSQVVTDVHIMQRLTDEVVLTSPHSFDDDVAALLRAHVG